MGHEAVNYLHLHPACLLFAGGRELQHPVVTSFRSWMDQIWILGERPASDCEHQRSCPNQHHQLGMNHFFKDCQVLTEKWTRQWKVNPLHNSVCFLQALLSGGSSILTVSMSVAFIPVSAAALPGYNAMPTIDAKLPYDFFSPFVWSKSYLTVHRGSTYTGTGYFWQVLFVQ